MQNKIIYKQDNISDYKKQITIAFSLLSLLIFCSAIYFNAPILIALPFTVIIIFLFILKIEMLFLLLLFVIPFSIEYDYKSSIIDLPSEPLLLLFAILLSFYVLLNYKKTKEKVLNSVLFFLIALHLFWTYFTTIYSTNTIVSIKTSAVKTIYILVFYIGTILLIDTLQKLKQILWILWIPTFITIIYALTVHATYGFTFDSINNALHPIYRNHVNYGVFITMFFPFLYLLYRKTKPNTIPRLLIQISAPTTLVAIYVTYTRGAWLALLAMPVYFLIIKMKWTKSILFALTVVVLLSTSYLFYNNHYQKYAPNYEKTIYHDKLSTHLNSTFDMEDMSTVERFYRWLAAIKMSEHNLMHGVGAGNFTANYKPYTVASYQTYISENDEKSTVHNYFLLMLTEQGLLGLIFYTAFIFYLLILIEKLYHQHSVQENKITILLIAFSICAFLLNNTLSDFLETNKVGSLFWINVGLLTIFKDKSNS